MNAEELAARLRMLGQFFRFNVECARRVSLLHGNINADNPCVVHTNVRYDVSAFVIHCDVHGLGNFPGFLLRRADYAEGIFQFHCGHGFSGSRLSLRLVRLGLRLLSGEKASARGWRERWSKQTSSPPLRPFEAPEKQHGRGSHSRSKMASSSTLRAGLWPQKSLVV